MTIKSIQTTKGELYLDIIKEYKLDDKSLESNIYIAKKLHFNRDVKGEQSYRDLSNYDINDAIYVFIDSSFMIDVLNCNELIELIDKTESQSWRSLIRKKEFLFRYKEVLSDLISIQRQEKLNTILG
jgi:hypothetical protein